MNSTTLAKDNRFKKSLYAIVDHDMTHHQPATQRTDTATDMPIIYANKQGTLPSELVRE